MLSKKLTRRGLIATGAAAPALAALHETVPHKGLHDALGGEHASAQDGQAGHHQGRGMASHDGFGDASVDNDANGFNPTEILRDFDTGKASKLADGRTLREWTVVAEDKEIEVAPGIFYPAWTYNGRIPGPTFRATAGDRMRVRFQNGSEHAHTMHFHGFHPDFVDGMPGIGEGRGGGLIESGEEFVYEFDAEPFGVHLYHCHTMPLAEHLAKGLYGAMVIDPPKPRPKADEMVMVMNGFDTNFDGENEIYAVNSIPFHYVEEPITVKRNELVRIYLVNLLEFDQINSFHIHATFFDYYPTGTRMDSVDFTDTIIQGQGQRGIVEVKFPFPGKYMFHAHKTEFAELGWLGFFVVED